jgi:hypothetical protein
MPRAFQRNLKHLKLTKGHYSAIKKRLSLYQYSGKRTNFCRYAESFWVRSWKNAQLKNCTVWKSNLKRAFTASGEERLVIPPSHFRAYNVVWDGRLSFIFDLTCQTQLLEEQVSKLRAKVSQSSPTCCPTVTLKKIRAFGSKLTLCSVNFLRHHKPGADTAQEQWRFTWKGNGGETLSDMKMLPVWMEPADIRLWSHYAYLELLCDILCAHHIISCFQYFCAITMHMMCDHFCSARMSRPRSRLLLRGQSSPWETIARGRTTTPWTTWRRSCT